MTHVVTLTEEEIKKIWPFPCDECRENEFPRPWAMSECLCTDNLAMYRRLMQPSLDDLPETLDLLMATRPNYSKWSQRYCTECRLRDDSPSAPCQCTWSGEMGG